MPDEMTAEVVQLHPVKPPPVPYVPSDRPRDRMYRYLFKRLGTLDVWRLLFDAEYKKIPGDLTEDEIALTDFLKLLWHLEAQEGRKK